MSTRNPNHKSVPENSIYYNASSLHLNITTTLYYSIIGSDNLLCDISSTMDRISLSTARLQIL